MYTPLRATPAALLIGLTLLGVLSPRVDAAVVCQKGKRVRLRAVACAGKEQPVVIDAGALPDLVGDVTTRVAEVETRVAEVEAVARTRLAAVDKRVAALETGVPLPACGSTAPECGGACPPGQVCSSIVTTKYDCVCLPGLVGCNADPYPTCGPGTCPTPTTCRQNAGWCTCSTTGPLP